LRADQRQTDPGVAAGRFDNDPARAQHAFELRLRTVAGPAGGFGRLEYRRGADHFVSKPFDPDDLKRHVAATIGHFWSFPHALLYKEPARLVALGLVTEVREPEGRRRRLLTITDRGRAALRAGQVALVVLAGGMATRMGGVVKALVEALPGKTFLELRLREIEALERTYGVAPPLWLMTSHSTEEPISR